MIRSGALSVVVPVFNNAQTVATLWERLRAVLGAEAEVVFVDDRSPDDASQRIRALLDRDPRLVLVRMGENVGQNRAVLVGFAVAQGAWVVNLDADLQDPPEAIPELLNAAQRQGADVVFAGRRGRYQSSARLLTSRLYKRTLSLATGVPPDAGIFAAVSRPVIDRI
ncbi:MAG: glycosyltransferase family 2 protein, partial [Myxococcota bacterium]